MMVDDATVLKRAKQLCTQHGANWDWAGRTNSNKPILDQMGRREYLTLAWEQLLEESAGRTAQTQEAAAAQSDHLHGLRSAIPTDTDIEAAKAMLANPDIAVTQIAQRLGISPATLYRYIPAARTANTPGV
jgi:hypothetical protein